MINPSFLNKTLLNRVLLSSIDLEHTIKSLGLNVLNYGVIDKETDKVEFIVQDDRESLLNMIRKYLMKKPIHEEVHVFWSNLNKYSILCDIKFVLENLDNIFDEDWDFWIIGGNKNGLLKTIMRKSCQYFY